MITLLGARIPLSELADIRIEDGPPMIKSENSRPTGWVYVDLADIDVGSYVADAQEYLRDSLVLPAGYTIDWSGQYECMQRAIERLKVVVPLTLLIITFLLYLAFNRIGEVLIVLAALPMSIAGSSWLLWYLEFDLSVAVGLIALAGVAVEIGVIMLVYLNQYRDTYLEQAREGSGVSWEGLREAVSTGALQRLRPIVMTMAAITAGLLPIMYGSGTGSEVMQRIAAPMVGGMVSTLVLALLVIPAAYLTWQGVLLRKEIGQACRVAPLFPVA